MTTSTAVVAPRRVAIALQRVARWREAEGWARTRTLKARESGAAEREVVGLQRRCRRDASSIWCRTPSRQGFYPCSASPASPEPPS